MGRGEFVLAKQRVINRLQQQGADPSAIANSAFNRVIYGSEHILSRSLSGIRSLQPRINNLQTRMARKLLILASREQFPTGS